MYRGYGNRRVLGRGQGPCGRGARRQDYRPAFGRPYRGECQELFPRGMGRGYFLNEEASGLDKELLEERKAILEERLDFINERLEEL